MGRSLNRPMIFLIRADADDYLIGKGHLKRMLALASELQAQKARCLFLSKRTHAARICFQSSKFQVIWISPRATEKQAARVAFSHLNQLRNSALVLDLRNVSDQIVRLYQPLKSLLFVFDDEENVKNYSVHVINCHRFENGVYPWALTDPKYLQFRKKVRPHFPARNILISLGGSDPAGGTPLVLNALSLMPLNQKIHVIVSKTYAYWSQLRRSINRCPHSLQTYHFVPNMVSFLKKIDFAIISGGMTRYETAVLGIPAVILSQNKEQTRLSKKFSRLGGQVYAGKIQGQSEQKLARHIFSLLNSRRKLKQIRVQSMKAVDGKGVVRIANLLTDEFKKVYGPVHRKY